MSLIVHAAARMLKLPSANSASIDMSGRCPAGADKLMLQVHGRNRSHVPGTTQQKPKLQKNTKAQMLRRDHSMLENILKTFNR